MQRKNHNENKACLLFQVQWSWGRVVMKDVCLPSLREVKWTRLFMKCCKNVEVAPLMPVQNSPRRHRQRHTQPSTPTQIMTQTVIHTHTQIHACTPTHIQTQTHKCIPQMSTQSPPPLSLSLVLSSPFLSPSTPSHPHPHPHLIPSHLSLILFLFLPSSIPRCIDEVVVCRRNMVLYCTWETLTAGVCGWVKPSGYVATTEVNVSKQMDVVWEEFIVAARSANCICLTGVGKNKKQKRSWRCRTHWMKEW